MNQSRILPFYMAYPLPMYYQEEDTVTRDLEYLQQMYPSEAKRYQKIIAEILNQIDYEGSCIYDEYPDRWQLYRLTQTVMDKIKRMDRSESGMGNKEFGSEGDPMENAGEVIGASAAVTERQWGQVEELVQVLLYYEIYKKRHVNHQGILKF
ncbi:MAG: hypothetical protein K2P65_11030 [Lachnospiraceae bacterium]|nr:hypothetical protein [Lachnospiraceae bacterium]